MPETPLHVCPANPFKNGGLLRFGSALLTLGVLAATLPSAQAQTIEIAQPRVGAWGYNNPVSTTISVDPVTGLTIQSGSIGSSYGGSYYWPPVYTQPYGWGQPIVVDRSINQSVLVNPTVINSSIRNSTLLNPTIIGAPQYPYITNYTVRTYTRPEPEVVVDPQYGVRYKRPSEY